MTLIVISEILRDWCSLINLSKEKFKPLHTASKLWQLKEGMLVLEEASSFSSFIFKAFNTGSKSVSMSFDLQSLSALRMKFSM